MADLTISVGEKATLRVEATFQVNGLDRTCFPLVSWTTSAAAIAELASAGPAQSVVVSGKTVGQAIVTASVGGAQAQYTVEVVAPTLSVTGQRGVS